MGTGRIDVTVSLGRWPGTDLVCAWLREPKTVDLMVLIGPGGQPVGELRRYVVCPPRRWACG